MMPRSFKNLLRWGLAVGLYLSFEHREGSTQSDSFVLVNISGENEFMRVMEPSVATMICE